MRDRIIVLDINKDIYKALKYKQYDNNNSLRIIVKDNDEDVDITKYNIDSYFKLPRGETLKKDCTIISNNMLEVMLTKDILSQSGMVSLEITLSDDEQVVTFFRIYLDVEGSINKDTTIILPEQMDVATEINTIKESYATKEYVDDAISDIEVGDIDLSNYATKKYVDDAISNIDIGDIDLSNYATKEYVNELEYQVDKNSDNINQILEIIDEPPTYTRPTLTTSLSSSNIRHNVSTSITITPKFTQNDAGAITSYSLTKGGNVIYTNTSASAYTDTITLSHGSSVTYSATVNYGDGVIKNTLLGIAYPSTSIKAGSISSNATVKGYALSYYGVINTNSIDNVDNLTNVLRTSKGSTLTFSMTNQRVVYMYPKSFGNLTSIKDANNFEYINSYTLSTMTLDGVEYNVYILTDAVTISGFKQIFS